MTIAEILRKMILLSNGNMHDINHLMKVHSFAKLICEYEGVDEHIQRIVEASSILHDIACPLCREKYGNTNGKRQEEEGMPLVRQFFAGTGEEEDFINRVVYLVGHHHTLTNVDGIDYQILIEADYLVNADESSYSTDNIKNMRDRIFKTKIGKELLNSMYL